MNEKEIAELRRRFTLEKHNVTLIRGCYVNENKEIISQFSDSLLLLPQEEVEKYLLLFKRTLSGRLGRNLLDISFTNQQVTSGEEHARLMALRKEGLKDETAVSDFFKTIVDSLQMEGNYLILLMHDVYDVPHRARDGQKLEDSSGTFSYILGTICPVKTVKPVLHYDAQANTFHSRATDWIVSQPELGFLFPAFDSRSTNIYNALYYTHSLKDSHPELVEAIFKSEPPMPAAQQQEIFRSVLGQALAEDCSYDVVQTVHEQFCERMAEHKASRESEPLLISKQDVRQVLEACGVSENRLTAFEESFDQAFGAGTELSPQNLVNLKQMDVVTPDVTIRVSPERSSLVETRMIDGMKYIMIRAESGVEVNGVPIRLDAGGSVEVPEEETVSGEVKADALV